MRVNDERAGKTYTYSYSNGNITEKKEYTYTTGELGEAIDIKSWRYEDSTWRDLLTSYDGQDITYDEIGNPITIASAKLTWLGRQLISFKADGNEVTYAYNGDGQRVSKTYNGTTTEYFYNGEILAGQKTGDDVIVFMYDNNGDAFGFIYNETEYYYVKNAQNDIIAIADADGTVIANYYYDALGKPEGITGNIEIANLNPLRYRSYYYDTESGLYYLNTRYYSADICRFINDDSQINDDTLGNNIFSYCSNNPITRADEQGEGWWIVAGAVVGAAVSFAGTVVSNVSSGRAWQTGWAGAVVGGAAAGHPVAGAFVGAFLESAINEVISYTPMSKSNGSSRKSNTHKNRVNSYVRVGRDTLVNGGVGAIVGGLSGKLVKGLNFVEPKKFSDCIFTAPAVAEHIRTGISELIGVMIDDAYEESCMFFGQEPVLEFYPSEESREDAT